MSSIEKHLAPLRLEAFSDGVFAIILTIMVLELRPPDGDTLKDLLPVLPYFFSYALSFINIIIYWNNHHHLLKTLNRSTGEIMWTNALLLFCLSLIPFTTAWMGKHVGEAIPTALYALVFLSCAISYTILEVTIINVEGKDSLLANAVGNDKKGKISLVAYTGSVIFAFVDPWISYLFFAFVALLWIWPDQRIERELKNHTHTDHV
jgi:uncharacterized membrane protein